jgi:hypothetical protein
VLLSTEIDGMKQSFDNERQNLLGRIRDLEDLPAVCVAVCAAFCSAHHTIVIIVCCLGCSGCPFAVNPSTRGAGSGLAPIAVVAGRSLQNPVALPVHGCLPVLCVSTPFDADATAFCCLVCPAALACRGRWITVS